MEIKVWNIVELMNSAWDTWVEEEKSSACGRQSQMTAGNPFFNQCCISQRVEYGYRLWRNNVKFYRQDKEMFLKTPISLCSFSVVFTWMGCSGIRGFFSKLC